MNKSNILTPLNRYPRFKNVEDVAVKDCKKSASGKHDWNHSQAFWFYCRHCLAQAVVKTDFNNKTGRYDVTIEIHNEV